MIFLIINFVIIVSAFVLILLKNYMGALTMGLFFLASLGLWIYSKISLNHKERGKWAFLIQFI